MNALRTSEHCKTNPAPVMDAALLKEFKRLGLDKDPLYVMLRERDAYIDRIELGSKAPTGYAGGVWVTVGRKTGEVSVRLSTDVPKSKVDEVVQAIDVRFNGYSTRKNYTVRAEIVSES